MLLHFNLKKFNMSKFHFIYAILLFSFFLLPTAYSQTRFKGGLVAGFNASQMDGDAAAGYHKLGLNAGVRATIALKGRYQLSTDILFSQRGSRTTENEAIITRNCTLNFLEVPVLLHLRDWVKKGNDEQTYYKVGLCAGLSYSRLFSASSNPVFTHEGVLNKFSQNGIAFQAGVQYFQNAHWGFSFKWTRAVSKLFNPEKFPSEPLPSSLPVLREHFLTFQTMYVF
jgi:hypothetical protein